MTPAVKRLDPTLDLVFKLLLTRELVLARHMLEGILGAPIRRIQVLNPGILGEQERDKGIVLDIRVVLDDGRRVDLEMQVRRTRALESRLVYYASRDFADQLVRGEGYENLTPTIVIVWMVEPLFPELDRLHSIFELRERHTHAPFGDQMSIHVLQLSTLPSSLGKGYDPRVERWARFFTARSDSELEQLASEDPMMALAKQTLDTLSQDPEARRLARWREDEIRLHRIDLRMERDEGRAEMLLELLELRFGPPSAQMKARIESATLEQLRRLLLLANEASSDVELEWIVSEDPVMTPEAVSQDPEARRLARWRDDELRLHRIDLRTERDEGRDEGRAEILLEQLEARFGVPSEVTRARVSAATTEQLKLWARRVLTANTLDEVFDP